MYVHGGIVQKEQNDEYFIKEDVNFLLTKKKKKNILWIISLNIETKDLDMSVKHCHNKSFQHYHRFVPDHLLVWIAGSWLEFEIIWKSWLM